MTVLEMVRAALEAQGADGLCAEECGCGLDDLAPCGSINENCEAARRSGPAGVVFVPLRTKEKL